MIGLRPLAIGVIVAALGAVFAVAVGLDGPVRAVLTIPFLLLGPGLAVSLSMGPMTAPSRLLVAVTGSVAATTLVSLLLLFTGVWSAGLGVALLAAVAIAIALRPLRAPTRLDPDAPTLTSADATA